MVDCAVILAAGANRRMGISGPKALLRIGEASFLSRHIDVLARNGVSRILVVSNTRFSGAFEAYQSDIVKVVIALSSESDRGSSHSLLRGLDALGESGVDGNALIMDADIVYEHELMKMILQDEGDQSRLYTIDRPSEDAEEVRVYGRERGEPALLGKALPPSLVDHLMPLGESLGIIVLTAKDVGYCRDLVRWILGDPPLRKELGCSEVPSEHEEVWQYLFSMGRLRVRQLPGHFLFAECDTPDDYTRIQGIVHKLSSV